MGLLLVVALLGAAAFGAYRFQSQRAKPFQFHYFKVRAPPGGRPSKRSRFVL